jgi:hypothetical protein
MDSERFDARILALGSDATRRCVLSHLVGFFGLIALAPEHAEAKRKKKKRKKKAHRCVTVGNVTISCRKGYVCCSPSKSTGAGCAPAGYPVCCVSDGYAHEPDIVCCDSFTDGVEGVCIDDYPNCCPESVGGGCCIDGYPVCCNNALGEYCCPLGTTCCESDVEDGCCDDTLRAHGDDSPGTGRGERRQRLGKAGRSRKTIRAARYRP